MARIPQLDPHDMPPELQQIAESLEASMGTVINSFKTYAHRPEIAQAFLNLGAAIMYSGTVPMPLKQKIGFVVSQVNGCRYCMSHTGGALLKFGETPEALQCAIAIDEAVLTPAEVTALTYAKAAAGPAGSATDAHVDALREHYSTPEIVEIAAVVGFFSFTNHVHDPLGIPLDEHYEALGAHKVG